MGWDRIKSQLTWVTVVPLIVLGWSQIVAVVYFLEWVEFARDVLTEENLVLYEQRQGQIDHLWEIHYPDGDK